MHDATVSGMRCTGQYGAITQGKLGGAADHAGEEFWVRLSVSSRPIVTTCILRTDVPLLLLTEDDQMPAAAHAAPASPADAL